MLKDCFWESQNFGKSVRGMNGTETDLCFERRLHPELPVQAYFTDVEGCLSECEGRVSLVKDLANDSVSSELLCSFEYSMDDDDWRTSVDAWMVFLKPLLKDELRRELVMSGLVQFRGERNKGQQESNVYNYNL